MTTEEAKELQIQDLTEALRLAHLKLQEQAARHYVDMCQLREQYEELQRCDSIHAVAVAGFGFIFGLLVAQFI